MSKFITKEVGENAVIITSCYDVDFEASIVIPAEIDGKTVIAIAPAAFANSNNIKDVTITIAETTNLLIGRGAFQNCHQLKEIKITGSGTVEIDNFAFLDCSCLDLLTIETNITNIGIGTFMGCAKLSTQNITLPDRLFIADSNTNFIYTISSNTAKIIAGFNNTNSIINFAAICNDNKSITTIEIADYAFSRTNIAAVLLRDQIRKIGKYAFADCSALHTIYYHFGDASLADKSVVFEEDAFAGCTNLNNIYFMGTGGFSDWCKIDFKNNYANPLYYDILNDRRYPKTFQFTQDSTDFADFVEHGHFKYDTFKDNITTNFKLQNNLVLTNCTRIPDCSFINNPFIQTIQFDSASEAISIGDFAFKDSSFCGFVDDKGVTATLSFNQIGQSAFEHCKIEEMSVTSGNDGLIIADCAFKNNLMTIFNLLSSAPNSKIQVGVSAFTNMFTNTADAGEVIHLTTPAALLNNFELHQVHVLTIYEDGTSLKHDAFENCINLTALNISIPTNITNVKMFSNLSAESFKKCSKLEYFSELPSLDTSEFQNTNVTQIADDLGRDYIIKSNCLLHCYFNSENSCDLIFGTIEADPHGLEGVTDILKFAFYHHSKANIQNTKLPNTTVRIHLPLTGKESYGIN